MHNASSVSCPFHCPLQIFYINYCPGCGSLILGAHNVDINEDESKIAFSSTKHKRPKRITYHHQRRSSIAFTLPPPLIRRGSTPFSTVLRPIRSFIINIFNKEKSIIFPGCNASPEENGTCQYPVWMTQKPTKEGFRGLNQNNFPGVYSPEPP